MLNHSTLVYHTGGAESEIARRIADMTQSELARRTGIPQASISEWARGINGMDLGNVQKLLKAIGGSVRRPVLRVRWDR